MSGTDGSTVYSNILTKEIDKTSETSSRKLFENTNTVLHILISENKF